MNTLISIDGVVFPVAEVQVVSRVISDYVHGPDVFRKVFKVILKGGLEVLWTGARYRERTPQEFECLKSAEAARQQIIDTVWPNSTYALQI
jgi:hypothetical protein